MPDQGGRRRLRGLPFVDGAFDKAICLSALHHVPDMGAAVREIARVLTNKGVAVFSEPGAGHATMPASTTATQDFGVLEQEVLIEPFMDMCRAAGFAQVHVCPIAYVIPEFELTLEEWRAWTRLPRTKRPLRAMEKMWRAMLEFAGAGKQSVLFEEAFAMRLVRLFQRPVEEHPFILAAKSAEGRVRPATFRAASRSRICRQAGTRESVTATVKASNTGSAVWPARSDTGVGHVRLGIQLLDAASGDDRAGLCALRAGGDMRPANPARSWSTFTAPAEPGAYELKFDLVAEGVTWFGPEALPLQVRPIQSRGRGESEPDHAELDDRPAVARLACRLAKPDEADAVAAHGQA